jgi:hypothetical protein
MGPPPAVSVVKAASRKAAPIVDVDREFVRGMYNRCGGSLDIGASAEEIGRELGLDEQQTAEVVARLTRTGYLRDVAAHLRIKITSRSIVLVERGE